MVDYSQFDPTPPYNPGDPGTLGKVPPVKKAFPDDPTDIAAERMKIEQQKQEQVDKPLIDSLRARQAQYESIANQRTPVPRDPKLTEPPLPPAQNFTDPIRALQNPGVFIATLGSFFSRAPMTAALNAGGAAMEAYHKGEAEVFQQKREEWKENLEVALAKNKIALDKLNNEWKKSEAATHDKLAKLQAIAAGEKMDGILASIQGGHFEKIDDILKGLQTAQEKAELAVLKGQEQERIARLRAGTTEQVAPLVDGIISGEQPPVLTGLYRQGAAVRQGLAEKHFDLANAQLEWERAKKQIQSLNGPQMTRFLGLAKSVNRTITEVLELSKELQLGGITGINRLQLEILKDTRGNTPEGQLAIRYLGAVNTLKEEFVTLAQGGYAPTEAAWTLANSQINGNFGPEGLAASLTEIKRLINYRMQAIPGIEQVGPTAPNRYLPGGGTAPAETPAASGADDGWGQVQVK